MVDYISSVSSSTKKSSSEATTIQILGTQQTPRTPPNLRIQRNTVPVSAIHCLTFSANQPQSALEQGVNPRNRASGNKLPHSAPASFGNSYDDISLDLSWGESAETAPARVSLRKKIPKIPLMPILSDDIDIRADFRTDLHIPKIKLAMRKTNIDLDALYPFTKVTQEETAACKIQKAFRQFLGNKKKPATQNS